MSKEHNDPRDENGMNILKEKVTQCMSNKYDLNPMVT